MEKVCRKRGERRRYVVDAAEEGGPEQSALARCCCGPMLHWELTGISQVSQNICHGRLTQFEKVAFCL
ncbi:hypothetical protein DPMN_098347 [Dreissena polymorpha]|uniref:Uncharacterized protein n=1 Tax=Dreissena polymorpha TaxID=45954 RepID=A0A9D4R684_DREPO|nr:hypothetical protein DPMN_098347 [Dreissena polymorpha]